MFGNLTGKFQSIFRDLTGRGVLTESNIRESMEEIRNALLEADVNYDVASEFVKKCSEECLGEEVIKNVKPGQQAVKVVYDKLVELLGENSSGLDVENGDPAVIMLCGLHGSGKTTTSAKLAKYLRDKTRKKVLLAACDVYRPAAIDQLELLAKDLGMQIYADRELKDVPKLAANAVNYARENGLDVVILDTAGRLQIDEELVKELIEVKKRTSPNEILLVGDAALGQEAVSVARHFDEALGISGIILTKMDGDARGGAALSMHQVTGRPIKFLTVGEKPTDLEMFHPDRMAGRILGMGDILSLYEKAAETIKEEEARELEERLKKNNFGFDDFLTQIKRMRSMGGMAKLLGMLPGMPQLPPEAMDDKLFNRLEGMINSMTPKERRNPDCISQSRRMRIAKGSGIDVKEVSTTLKQFQQMRTFMAKLTNGGMGGLGNLLGGRGLGSMLGGLGGNPMGGMGGMGGNPMAGLGGMGGMGGSMHSESHDAHKTAAQKKRLEQKKQAKKSRKNNRRK